MQKGKKGKGVQKKEKGKVVQEKKRPYSMKNAMKKPFL